MEVSQGMFRETEAQEINRRDGHGHRRLVASPVNADTDALDAEHVNEHARLSAVDATTLF
jgi:hypothetical protein